MLSNIYFVILGISFLISSTVYWRKDAPAYFKFFPPFLLLTIIVEFAGRIMAQSNVPNIPLYAVFLPSEFVFYFLILSYIIQSARWKKLIRHSCWVYSIMILASIVWVGINSFPTIIYSVGCILLISFCSRYFYETFEMPNSSNPLREPNFWIVCALFIFYGGSLPVWIATNLMYDFSDNTLHLLSTILLSLNYILYSSFTIAFLCNLKPSKPLS